MVLAVVVVGALEVFSPRMTSVTSPHPLMGVRFLEYCQKWASMMENQFVLKVIWVWTSLGFPVQHPLSNTCVPFSLPYEENPITVKYMCSYFTPL